MNFNRYLEDLQTLMEESESDEVPEAINAEQLEALNHAADALAFCKTMFDTFQLNGMVPEDAEFDLSHMENLIDALVGELSAAVLHLKAYPIKFNVIRSLRGTSEDIHKHNKLAKEEDKVPHVVEAGFSRLADRIESTKVTAPGPDIA